MVPLLLYQRTDEWGSEYETALSVAKTSQSTDRIDRTVHNVAICRTFLGAALLWLIDPQRMVTDRLVKYRPRIDRLEMNRFAALSPPR
jgi:hypothetical protein